jgi:predicted ribosome quality control (RQC) complex YloA/Tae2 family protein
VSAAGFEILVGRNAKGNDELTRRIGKGNDIFLHVSGRAGAHVLIRNVPGKSVPLETLMDAAQLALYYSLQERSRGELASGMTAEVDYTPLKHVRKPKGLKPGLVLLAAHKTLRVRLDPVHLERIRDRGAN